MSIWLFGFAGLAAAETFTATIPSTEGNPFIETSNLPEGTLFIIFGAILGGLGLALFVWRLASLWSARRAAKQSEAQFTALEPSYGGPFIDPVRSASASVENLPGQPSKQAKPPATQNSNLFFSPTAQVMNNTNASQPMVSTTSYLPSGYYSSQPSSSGPGTINSRSRPFSSIRDSHRPPSVVTSDTPPRAYTPPPASELSMPTGSNQPRTRRQRPPSAYLDDLLRS